jgi:hypothetical protein
LEAIAAVDRLIAARLERHFGRASAAAACRTEHLALTAAEATATAAISAACGTAGLTCLTAIGAAIWFVLEALLSVEFLLTGCKCKLRAAIDARK